MKTENIIKSITALPRGAALCDHWAYLFLDDNMELEDRELRVDILAWRVNSQQAEDKRLRDLSNLWHAIEALPGVANLKQVGDINHKNGCGWTYEVTLA